MFGPIILLLLVPFYAAFAAWYLSINSMPVSFKNIFIFIFSGYLAGIVSVLVMAATWEILAPSTNTDSTSQIYAIIFWSIMATTAYISFKVGCLVVKKYNKAKQTAASRLGRADARRC